MTTDQDHHVIRGALHNLAVRYGKSAIVNGVYSLWPDSHWPGAVPTIPARAGDPGTSQSAADRHRSVDAGRFGPKSIKAKVLGLYRFSRWTAMEAGNRVAEQATSGNPAVIAETARKRVSELVRAGFLAESGDFRNNDGSPDLATVWEITSAGTQALVNLETHGTTRVAS